jgi:CheY-like chemotaxis protein
MNLPNRILKFLSFQIEKKCGKDHLVRMLILTIASSVIVIYFLILAIISIFSFNFLLLMLSLSASILIAINQIIIVKKLQLNSYIYSPIVIPAIIFQFFLWTGSVSAIGTLIIALLPLITIGLLGFNKGAIFSLVFAIVAAMGLFLPLEVNGGYNLDIIFKVNFFVSYFIIIFIAYLFDVVKQNSIFEMEKQMLDQKSSNKLKEQFIANLSHQIRTPLNNIMVISNILENTDIDDKQKDMIDTIHASTNNLVNVVNSMVEISNVDIKERGDFNIPFNLHSTIHNTIRLFSSQYSAQTNFNLKIDDSIPSTLNGDPVKIKQIFLNLIENILKNKSSGKTNISITVGKKSENTEEVMLNFEIRSNRPILLPMNEGHNLFITNETTYTSASTQVYVDLLELSITQKLIESNGGKLTISLSAQDASFNFPFSLKKSIAHPEVAKLKVSSDGTSEKITIQHKVTALELDQANVLLVEDNLINQKIVVLSLKKLVKNIDIANNGKEALDKFGTSRFDLILMDIQMPIMNGIVATKKIREIEESSNTHTPIIAITANALLGDKEECLAAGMDDYISKPFQIEVLIQKMKNLLKSIH